MTYRFELYRNIRILDKRINFYKGILEDLLSRNTPTQIIEYFEISKFTCELQREFLKGKLEILSRI